MFIDLSSQKCKVFQILTWKCCNSTAPLHSDVWGRSILFKYSLSTTKHFLNVLNEKCFGKLCIISQSVWHSSLVFFTLSFNVLTFILTILIVPNVLLFEQHKANQLNSPKLRKSFERNSFVLMFIFHLGL